MKSASYASSSDDPWRRIPGYVLAGGSLRGGAISFELPNTLLRLSSLAVRYARSRLRNQETAHGCFSVREELDFRFSDVSLAGARGMEHCSGSYMNGHLEKRLAHLLYYMPEKKLTVH